MGRDSLESTHHLRESRHNQLLPRGGDPHCSLVFSKSLINTLSTTKRLSCPQCVREEAIIILSLIHVVEAQVVSKALQPAECGWALSLQSSSLSNCLSCKLCTNDLLVVSVHITNTTNTHCSEITTPDDSRKSTCMCPEQSCSSSSTKASTAGQVSLLSKTL